MVGLIIEGCATFIEYIGALLFWKEKIDNSNIKRIILMLIPIVLLTIGINLTDIVSINSILLYFIFSFIYILLFFKDVWLEKILLSSIYFFLIVICDYSCATISGLFIGKQNYIEILSTIGSFERICFLTFDKSVLITTSFAVRKFISKFIPLSKLQYLIAIGAVGSTLVYATYNFSNLLALLGWSVYLLFAIIFMAMFGLYTNWKEAEKSKELSDLKNESYINYYNSLLTLQTEKERLIHDIKYQHINILQMLDEKKYDDCRNYLLKITAHLESQEYIQYSGNPYIDFILNHMQHEAEQKNIDFKIDTDYIGKIPELEQQDINIIFGNLLDNAFEAVISLTEMNRWIEIKLAKVHQMFFISISNTTKGSPSFRNGKLQTTKKENSYIHGIGLQNVERSLSKYNGILEIHFDKNIFTAKATLFL